MLGAESFHREDAKIATLAKGKTIQGPILPYVRADWPFGSRAPPAMLLPCAIAGTNIPCSI